MLILVRHGQTAANAQRLLLGRADPPLNDLGLAQAAALAIVATPARVISSPLMRARRTAETFGAPVEIDDRWVEVDYGIYDGTPLTDVPAEVWQRWRDDLTFVPEGGESLASVGERVREACAGLFEEAKESDVVVVSHVSPIKAAVAWALGVGDDASLRMFLDVASVSRIGAGTARQPVLRTYNETSHLDGLTT